jgi:hypothetical protein
MLYTKDLSKVIFSNFDVTIDEFIVISGWLGFAQIEEALGKNVKITALFGMSASSGVPGPNHAKLKIMDMTNKNLQVYYALPGNDVHSKIYVWKSRGVIKKALIGSANFTYQGINLDGRESLQTVEQADFNKLNDYLKQILDPAKIERCSSTNLKTRITSIPRVTIVDPLALIIDGSSGNVRTIRLTLLDEKGNVPEKSGINWGHGNAHTKPNDTYIKISKAAIKTGFFVPKSYERIPGVPENKVKNVRIPVEVIWDDGTAMDCLEEGDQYVGEVEYPKQISSAVKKEILGVYLRNRLGVPLGQKVTMEDLKRYGRTYIDVTATGPNSYYMDFSKITH